ncbi:N-acetylmuramoyl-L-alanine amidase [Clostridium formicaceticum]|uniref:N-acetylmuramoyl-L-alanine amidase LytC n=1 Tax=Clostridium formicaceticum TaxID=1497 RepID=A0AAC9RLX3_9CLOT|nr:N-acetylmuramoyl-L-alanine amidase [Clostridium formicaceticum]AOY75189.1 stage II sporulation protein SpoIID [Clostridium formicaceticum]ARE89616.1 N-acetylmuramoyl-L-alanine amidase LytC precursor [Clostridium formicaceticum]
MKQVGEIIYINLYNPYEKKIISKSLEELVKELVAWSMPLTFHIEALKSQSIIMRTRIAKGLKVFGGSGVKDVPEADLSLDTFEGIIALEDYRQVWGEEYERNINILKKVIDDTKDIIIFFNDKPIDARFHTVCGGATENSENVDGNIVQYLRKVLCSYCEKTPYSLNYRDLSIKDIEERLGVQFAKENVVKNMEIENMFYDIVRDEQGRVIKLKIAGKEFEGKQLMELLHLNSTRVSWRPEKIRFFTRGKGDGVGLCQYGANQMAKEGKKAEEILKYYYTGIVLKNIEIRDIKKPLKGKTIVIDAAHGGEKGEDNVGASGLREKDVNLEICQHLRERLQELGAEVYITREKDQYIPLTQRAAMVNKISPHFFITIHQNYFKYPSISGTEVYYYRGDKEARRLAKEIVEEISEKLGTVNRGVKTAEFFLLRDVKVSSLHIEVAYLSNPEEEKLLMKEAFKRKAALAIANGIVKYYGYAIE